MLRKIIGLLSCGRKVRRRVRQIKPKETLCTPSPRNRDPSYLAFRKLGRGSTGSVHQVFDEYSGKILTCKRVALTKRACAIREIIALRKIDAPNLPVFHSYVQEDGHIYILSEYIEGMDLFDYVTACKGLRIADVQGFAFEMAICIKQCIDNGLVHLDVKMENFIVVDPYHCKLKMIDFGTAHDVQVGDKVFPLQIASGTHGYSAPEIYEGFFHRNSDVWSLGICVWILTTGEFPFPDAIDLDQASMSTYLAFPTESHRTAMSYMSPHLRDFLQKTIKYDPNRRTPIEDLLRHSWFEVVI